MSIVNGNEIFAAARKGHYAVGAFNINNLEWTRAILAAAQETNTPIWCKLQWALLSTWAVMNFALTWFNKKSRQWESQFQL